MMAMAYGFQTGGADHAANSASSSASAALVASPSDSRRLVRTSQWNVGPALIVIAIVTAGV